MPYLSVRTSVALTDEKGLILRRALEELIAVIPGKTIDNCMIDISSGCDLYMSGGPVSAAFVDLRLFKSSSEDSKQTFVAELCGVLKDQLGIEPRRVYVNMLELAQWGSGGAWKS